MLRSGNYFDFLTPEKSVFKIEDIAHGLSNLCRFNGQCKEFYSVAQHSVLASRFIQQTGSLPYDALMHDAAEAFIGDIVKPLKRLLSEYSIIEKRVEAAIFERFNVSNPMPDAVKHIDLVMLAMEQRDLMPPHNDEWGCLQGIEPLSTHITPWTPKEAYKAFLNRYDQIMYQNQPFQPSPIFEHLFTADGKVK